MSQTSHVQVKDCLLPVKVFMHRYHGSVDGTTFKQDLETTRAILDKAFGRPDHSHPDAKTTREWRMRFFDSKGNLLSIATIYDQGRMAEGHPRTQVLIWHIGGSNDLAAPLVRHFLKDV